MHVTGTVQEWKWTIFFWRSEGGIDTGDHTSWRRYSHGLRAILISIYSFVFPSVSRQGTDFVHPVEGIVEEGISRGFPL